MGYRRVLGVARLPALADLPEDLAVWPLLETFLRIFLTWDASL